MMIAELKRQAANDNRLVIQRMRADEAYARMVLMLGAAVLFAAMMWVLA